MASVTLHDAETGTVVGTDEGSVPDPVVAAEDRSKLTLALDGGAGRATVQFVADPGERRLLADVTLEDDDELPDVYRAVQGRVAESDLSMAPPGSAPAHLNVFHYLATPDPAVPDAEIRAHIVSTDEPIEVGVPTAAEAMSVVAFFRDRAPWKTVAVQAVGAGASTADAEVVVTVDTRYDDLTWVSRDESWVDEDAVPEDLSVEAPEPTGAPSTVPDFSLDATGVGEQPEDAPSKLRVFDGETGELVYDAKHTADTPDVTSEAASRRFAEGQVLVVDPAAGVVRARLAAADANVDRSFYVEYTHQDDGDVLAGFVEELDLRVDDLGLAFAVDVGDVLLEYEGLTAEPSRPAGLGEVDLAWLGGAGEGVDFAAEDGTTAVALAAYLRPTLGGDPSVAVSETGRTDDLADVDVVIEIDPDCEGIEPLGRTRVRLADGHLRGQLASVGEDVAAVVDRIEAVTGTVEARQRVFAAAMSRSPLTSRGLTVAPVDDDPLLRRRKQARYLLLYGLVLAGVAVGVDAGRFEPLAALLDATYQIDLLMLEGSVVAGLAAVYVVEGQALVGGCFAALLAGAYWLFGYPRGPLSAARALAKTVRKQVTGGAGSGTVPNTVRELADPVAAAIDDLHEGYRELSDVEGTVAAGSESFADFLEAHLFSGRTVPDVRVVDRGPRRRSLIAGMVLGAVVGTLAAAVTLGALWVTTSVAARDPTRVFEGLLGAVGLTAAVSVLKAAVVRYGGSWPPRWPTAR